MKLTVIIPIYNEINTIGEILKRVQVTKLAYEILLVDDGSYDGSREFIKELDGQDPFRIILHKKNQGKGAAVRTGIQNSKGNIILIQDADLEYDPNDYLKLIKPIEEGIADVVYGSRFLEGNQQKALLLHSVANRMLTSFTNLIYKSKLTDMETCYKVFRRDLVVDIPLHSCGFEFEPEITAKILKRKYRIIEVPVSFNPRGYEEGKKIVIKDAFKAIWALIKYRFVD